MQSRWGKGCTAFSCLENAPASPAVFFENLPGRGIRTDNVQGFQNNYIIDVVINIGTADLCENMKSKTTSFLCRNDLCFVFNFRRINCVAQGYNNGHTRFRREFAPGRAGSVLN